MSSKSPKPRPRRMAIPRCGILRRPIRLLLLIVFLLLTLTTFHLHHPQTDVLPTEAWQKWVGKNIIPSADESGTPATQSLQMDCAPSAEHIRQLREKHNLREPLEYTRRYIRFTRSPIPRKSVSHIHQRFKPLGFGGVDWRKKFGNGECPPPLDVTVPASAFPKDVNASDFLFGVSTTLTRLTDPATSAIKEWAYWLTDGEGRSNGGKLILFLAGASTADVENAQGLIRTLGIDVDVRQAEEGEAMAVRYFNLVPAMYDHIERPSKKWLVTCDDDTFFPYMNSLVETMSRYDPNKPLYIGALSEDVQNIGRHGSQAFGGAGVFLSVPLARQITRHKESCASETKVREADTGWGPQGDILLRKCIYENTDVRLTALRDLWQLDITGDAAGFYESGGKPLSLHHYRGGGWHLAHPLAYSEIARTCGEDCVLMRIQTADNFVLSGYSIAHYPRGLDFDLDQMERTFFALSEDEGWNLDYRMGPQRASLLGTGRKIAWEMRESGVREDGSVVQVYTRGTDDGRFTTLDGKAMSRKDGIIELVWFPGGAEDVGSL